MGALKRGGVDCNPALAPSGRVAKIQRRETGAGRILDKGQYNFGYDAQTGEYGNLMTKGIIDAAKVARCALQDAASVAGPLLTTEAMVAELPKKASAAPAMPPGGIDY
jgi:chaperonin GroEL